MGNIRGKGQAPNGPEPHTGADGVSLMKPAVRTWFAIIGRWLLQPWTDAGLVMAIVGAAMTPAFLVASADLWHQAAANQIAISLIEAEATARIGVTLTTNTSFNQDLTDEIGMISDRISQVNGLSQPQTTAFTFAGVLVTNEPSVASLPLRIVARSGAIEALEIVDSDPTIEKGVFIPDWLASDAHLAPGDEVVFASDADPTVPGAEIVGGIGSQSRFVVRGTYRPLWSEQTREPTGYWAALPPELVPRYLEPFNGPAFELLVTDQETLFSSGLTGAVRWDAPVNVLPSSAEVLDAMDGAYLRLERDLAVGPESAAVSTLADQAVPRPTFESALPSLARMARQEAAFARQPIDTARLAGVLVGLGVAAAAGVLIPQRKRAEFRLLAGEGDRWGRIGFRIAAQVTAPVALGTVAGVLLARLSMPILGPTSLTALRPVDWSGVLLAAGGCALAISAAAAVVGQSALEARVARRSPLASIAVMAALLSAFLWAQVGRTDAGTQLDFAVVALPLMALIASAASGTLALRWVLGRFQRAAGRLPPTLYLPWRHLARGQTSAAIATVALGVGIGLVVTTSHLVTTLDRTVETKLATELGGETLIDVFGVIGSELDAPPRSTFVRYLDTRVTPGNASIRVVAIDPATAEALTWPEEFGPSLETVLGKIDAEPDEGAIPVLAVAGWPVPVTGTFGTVERIRFRVVGTVESAPLASPNKPTLLAAATRINAHELARLTAAGLSTEGMIPPVSRLRRRLVSEQTPAELADYLELHQLTARETITRTSRLGDSDVLGPSLAFSYLRLLGYVSAAAAVAGLALHLSVRRRTRALSTVILSTMGFGPRGSSLALALEVGLLLAVAALSVVAIAPALARQVGRRFDPAPSLPPVSISTSTDPGVWLVVGAGCLLVMAVVALAEWRWSRRPGSEILNRAG